FINHDDNEENTIPTQDTSISHRDLLPPLPITSMCNDKLDFGDMIGIKDGDTKDKKRLWPNGIIPFTISLELTNDEDLILKSMKHIEQNTCIRFRRRTVERDYVSIIRDRGCYSYIGKRKKGGKQPLSIGDGCAYFGTVVHELLHAVGLIHEQNRADRDDYVKILWKNIDPKFKDQFKKINGKYFPQFLPFDYNSVMLYGSFTFTKNRKLPTMLAKAPGVNPILPEVYKKKSMSVIDAKRVRRLYDCENIYKKSKIRIFKITEFYL
ncbi:astacin-like metalloprotease toxin-like protein, partial [Dinothrombium tinctorium]